MPHCIVEHSSSFDADLLLSLVFQGAFNSGLFEPDGSDIKVRSLLYHNYLTGQTKTEFVHVVLKILSGRTPEQKKALSNLVLEQFNQLQNQPCSFTVEVVDIDRASYAKRVVVVS